MASFMVTVGTPLLMSISRWVWKETGHVALRSVEVRVVEVSEEKISSSPMAGVCCEFERRG